MLTKYKKHLHLILCLIFLCIGFLNISTAQNKNEQTNSNTAIREEIQRYLGYEPLPARYISLPYDTTMNTTVRGPFVDIGYLFLGLIPIFFLLGYRKRPLAGSLFMLFCFIVLTISVSNSLILSPTPPNFLDKTDSISNFVYSTSFSEAPISYLNAQLHLILRTLYAPFEAIFGAISGNADYITYPLLILLFVGLFFVLLNRIKQHPLQHKALFLFTYIFGFLWLLLTAGIIWYGYLMIAIATIYAIYPFSKQETSSPAISLRYFMAAFIGLAMLLFTALRMTNSQSVSDKRLLKASLFDLSMLRYQTGVFNQRESIDFMFDGSNIMAVLDKINAEEQSLVYRAGTIFPYFIKKNNRRVLTDNQLDIFQNLVNKFQDQQTISAALKASGYKYLLVDLNTSQIDVTPEKTLTKKFESLLRFLYKNPNLSLLTTDRQIIVPGEQEMVRKVIPDSQNNEHVGVRGRFAIYEIL